MRTKKDLFSFLIMLTAVIFTGCEFIGDVVRAGYYSGIFLVVLIIVNIIFVVAILNKRK